MLQRASTDVRSESPKAVFVSYAHTDENAQKFFLLALSQLERDGYISAWYDRKIRAGEEWDRVINSHLASADVVLFLVSPGFLASSYCRGAEVELAMARAAQNETIIVPIILLECNWKKESFGSFQALPKDGVPITQPDGALNADLLQNVIEGLRLALIGLWTNDPPTPCGATIAHASRIGGPASAPSSVAGHALLKPTSSFTPVLLRAVKVDHHCLERLHFVTDVGTGGLSPDQVAAEGRRVTNYFWECAALRDNADFWVNFSPYESNRMLPTVLAGTHLGRDLLASDCQLKRFAASLLHPDTDTGRKYWDQLYQRARQRWQTSEFPFHSFHKVWISADRAEVFVKERDAIFNNLNTGRDFDLWGKEANTTFAVVGDCRMKAECGIDSEALAHNGEALSDEYPAHVSISAVSAMATELFEELIVPVIEHELNEGSHFAIARQIFHSILLANWLRHYLNTMPDVANAFRYILGSNEPTRCNVQIYSMTDTAFQSGTKVEYKPSLGGDFSIPENAEFYQQYIRLFQEGLYHVARREEGDRTDAQVVRVYFSGGIHLTQRLAERL